MCSDCNNAVTLKGLIQRFHSDFDATERFLWGYWWTCLNEIVGICQRNSLIASVVWKLQILLIRLLICRNAAQRTCSIQSSRWLWRSAIYRCFFHLLPFDYLARAFRRRPNDPAPFPVAFTRKRFGALDDDDDDNDNV